MKILTLNAGSSSLKYELFSFENDTLQPMINGIFEAIGKNNAVLPNHLAAFQALKKLLDETFPTLRIDGVGHRVVHGGKDFYEPTLLTDDVLKILSTLDHLAPLHNPINREGILFAKKIFKKAIHVAIFDTGFHHTLPEKVARYAISHEVSELYGIRRYGFHGINHQQVAKKAAHFLQKPLSSCCFISLHLGNGASACFIQQGLSHDTSMGMTPLAGLIMGTRSGDIDPAIPLYLLTQGLQAQEIDDLLNQKSGLLGICQENDMRRILEQYDAGSETAQLAIEMFVLSIQKTIGAYLSQCPTLDALIFTGGIGENASFIRQQILSPLKHFGFYLDNEKNKVQNKKFCQDISKSGIPILIIQSDEEGAMAEAVLTMLK